MEYISCFSGIGGLEGDQAPIALCEIDPDCHIILRKKYPDAFIHADINTFDGIKCDVVAGGWPCQDISIAGKQKGLSGENSGLFYTFVKAAVNARAHTIIAENVPNLLKMEDGAVFKEVLKELVSNGYEYCAWRMLNARAFCLPHHRNRVMMVASKIKKHSYSLFRDIPFAPQDDIEPKAAGFYWTAGTHSINYSLGYVPTIKIGSSLSIPSPPAVHFGNIVRQLSAKEALFLQGFDPSLFEGLKDNVKYRMAGNAVAQPMGKFVVNGVLKEVENSNIDKIPRPGTLFATEGDEFEYPDGFPKAGIFESEVRAVRVSKPKTMAKNLHEFIDSSDMSSLSKRAASGLLKRLDRSGQSYPRELRVLLEKIRENNA